MKTKRNRKAAERQAIRLATYHGGRAQLPLARRVFGGMTASYYESRRRSKAVLDLLEQDAAMQADRLRAVEEGMVHEFQAAFMPQLGQLEPVPVSVPDYPAADSAPEPTEQPESQQPSRVLSPVVVAAPAPADPEPAPDSQDIPTGFGRRTNYQNTLRAQRVRRRVL